MSGLLPVSHGGTGLSAPALVAGAGISIAGSWPNNTITNTTLGTVTSIQVSGGTTGLTYSGGPVTTSGTITLSGTLVVSNGGTGLASTTPYAVVAGGSTSTGTLQQVSGLGTAGQVLTSNGAGALPSWQAGGGGASGFVVTTASAAANYTVSAGTKTFIYLSDLTGQANRNVILPTATSGDEYIFVNLNPPSSGFVWTFTNGTVKDYGQNTVTTLNNLTTYRTIFGGANFQITN